MTFLVEYFIQNAMVTVRETFTTALLKTSQTVESCPVELPPMQCEYDEHLGYVVRFGEGAGETIKTQRAMKAYLREAEAGYRPYDDNCAIYEKALVALKSQKIKDTVLGVGLFAALAL